jgi:hypothetical protein
MGYRPADHALPVHPLDTSESRAFVARLLLDTSNDPDPVARISALTPEYWMELLSNPANRSLCPVLFYLGYTKAIHFPREILLLLEQKYGARFKNYSRLMELYSAIAALLEAGAISYRFFKGSDLAARLYPWPEIRNFRDIDVVVMPDRLDQARNLLEKAGWSIQARMSYHDVLRKDGITLDLHHSLLGRAESMLHHFSPSHTESFIRGTIGAEEEFLVILLKLFSETVFDKCKLLDLYLFRRQYPLDADRLNLVVRNHCASLPMQVLGSIVDSYQTGKSLRGLSRLAVRRPALWALAKHACLLASVDRSFEKLVALAFPGKEQRAQMYPGQKVSLAGHISHSLFIFLGLRFLDTHSLRSTCESV